MRWPASPPGVRVLTLRVFHSERGWDVGLVSCSPVRDFLCVLASACLISGVAVSCSGSHTSCVGVCVVCRCVFQFYRRPVFVISLYYASPHETFCGPSISKFALRATLSDLVKYRPANLVYSSRKTVLRSSRLHKSKTPD